jgi:hypothetical protein
MIKQPKPWLSTFAALKRAMLNTQPSVCGTLPYRTSNRIKRGPYTTRDISAKVREELASPQFHIVPATTRWIRDLRRAMAEHSINRQKQNGSDHGRYESSRLPSFIPAKGLS